MIHIYFKLQESTLKPIALRRAKTLRSFGPSECNRVKGKNLLLRERILSFKSRPVNEGDKKAWSDASYLSAHCHRAKPQ